MKYCAVAILVLLGSCSHAQDREQNWDVKKLNNQQILFENGKSIDTHLYDLTYIDQIDVGEKVYLIISGRGCEQCDANLSIYVHSPTDGDMLKEANQPRYTYPGSIYDPFSDEVIFSSELYYGNCLPDEGPGLIWVQKSSNSTGDELKESIFILDLKNDSLTERKIGSTDSLSSIKENVEIELTQGNCFEIEGITQTAEM